MNPEDADISQEEFDSFVEMQISIVKEKMVDGAESIMPMVIVNTLNMQNVRGLGVFAINLDFNEFDEKKAALMEIGRKVYQEQLIPLAIVLISEAWIARSSSADIQPRHHPDKRECVIVAACTFGVQLVKFASIPVERDKKNRMRITKDTVPAYDKIRLPLLNHFFEGYLEKLKPVEGESRVE